MEKEVIRMNDISNKTYYFDREIERLEEFLHTYLKMDVDEPIRDMTLEHYYGSLHTLYKQRREQEI